MILHGHFLGYRSLAHLSFRGVFLLLFFIKSAMKLVVKPPMTVDLSLVVAAVTDADACSFADWLLLTPTVKTWLWRKKKDCWSQNFTLTNSPTQNNICLLEDKIQNWGVYLFTFANGSYAYRSKKWRLLNQWMIWNLRVLPKGTHGPDFELLEARIASALNKIIQSTRFKRRVSLEEMKAHKEDRFLRGILIAYLIYEYFQVTGANDSVENYAELFTDVL